MSRKRFRSPEQMNDDSLVPVDPACGYSMMVEGSPMIGPPVGMPLPSNGPPVLGPNGPPVLGLNGPPALGLNGPSAVAPNGPGPLPPISQGCPPFTPFGFIGEIIQNIPPIKDLIKHQSCILYPPNPNVPPPSTRERPPGCRTIFIGGLPDLATEDIITEVFSSFGEICTLRLSKKNYAHLRYQTEESVEKALFLSGYRMKIENKDDKPNTGRLHVDYAQARDDFYDWECRQRAIQREQRHIERMKEAMSRPLSPQPMTHYNDHEASILCEKLKNNEEFLQSTHLLISWLDRGFCVRRSANTFYSLIQIVNSHVRRLIIDKDQHDKELHEIKEKFKNRIEYIITQFGQIEKVFNSSTKQKSWDHFSKPQRKNIDQWHKQAKEILRMQQEDFIKQREEDEMELSDTEDTGEIKTAFKKVRREDIVEAATAWAQSNKAESESDDMKYQLEAYKNEVEIFKHEAATTKKSLGDKVKALEQTLKGMQEQLLNAKQEKKIAQEELQKIKKRRLSSSEVLSSEVTDTDTSISNVLNNRQAKIIGLLSTFLHVHPFGASLEYIASYLRRIDISFKVGEIEEILTDFTDVFQQETFGVGASMEKRWLFLGFTKDVTVIS